MNYAELKKAFRALKRSSPLENQTAHIIFTVDSFSQSYPLLSRTYRVGSDNKAFWSKLGSRSIFASCLDGSDQNVRLDWYMADEGNKGGWKVQDCYILEQMRNTAAIPNVTKSVLEAGVTCCFFGDTCIQVRESVENGRVRLEPVAGDQVVCGDWVELDIDRVYGYCTLLERHFNQKRRVSDAS